MTAILVTPIFIIVSFVAVVYAFVIGGLLPGMLAFVAILIIGSAIGKSAGLRR